MSARDPDGGGHPSTLIGRAALVIRVNRLLDARRSVLLFGPPGIGKSAIVAAVARREFTVADPFEHVSRQCAAALRRVIEAGGIVLAAARSARRTDIGAVGRVLWRMEAVRVEPLGPRNIRTLLSAALDAGGVPCRTITPAWLSEAAQVADGIPGRAVAMASAVGVQWRAGQGVLPPRLALVVAWQDGLSPAAARPRVLPVWEPPKC